MAAAFENRAQKSVLSQITATLPCRAQYVLPRDEMQNMQKVCTSQRMCAARFLCVYLLYVMYVDDVVFPRPATKNGRDENK